VRQSCIAAALEAFPSTPAAEPSLHLPNPRALAQAIPEFQSLGYKMRKGMAKLGITYDDLYGNDRNDGTDCHR
jgi:hypothetical protein